MIFWPNLIGGRNFHGTSYTDVAMCIQFDVNISHECYMFSYRQRRAATPQWIWKYSFRFPKFNEKQEGYHCITIISVHKIWKLFMKFLEFYEQFHMIFNVFLYSKWLFPRFYRAFKFLNFSCLVPTRWHLASNVLPIQSFIPMPNKTKWYAYDNFAAIHWFQLYGSF